MARRALSLTATTVLVASLAAGADTPKASPSPTPSPRPRSLGEVAREKKATGASSKTASPSLSPSPEPSKDPGHVFTNEDLPAQPSPPAIASPGPGGTGRGTVTKLPGSAVPQRTYPKSESGEAPAEEEKGWRTRATSLRDAIAAAEKQIPDLEDRIAAVRNDRNPTNLMDPNREQHRQAEMAKLQAELESVRAGLERSRQALTDLEEEARRKGIPPGWLR